MFCLRVYKYTVYVLGVHRCQKVASESLELELQTVVSSHGGTGNQSWYFGKAANAPNH